MLGETVKFHKYEGSSGKISIPRAIANSLSWDHKNELTIVIATLSNQIGLLIFKKGSGLKLDSGAYEVEETEGGKGKKRNMDHII